MSPVFPVHEIRLGKLEALIWESRHGGGFACESDYRVAIRSAREPANASPCFEPGELAIVADLTALAHLWIQEQVYALVPS